MFENKITKLIEATENNAYKVALESVRTIEALIAINDCDLEEENLPEDIELACKHAGVYTTAYSGDLNERAGYLFRNFAQGGMGTQKDEYSCLWAVINVDNNLSFKCAQDDWMYAVQIDGKVIKGVIEDGDVIDVLDEYAEKFADEGENDIF